MARASRASLPVSRRAALLLMNLFAGEARDGNDRLAALLTKRPADDETDLLGRVTPKQVEVLALVARGFSNKEIANELDGAELIAKLWAR